MTIYDIHWPLSKVTRIQHIQTSFPKKTLGRLKPNFICSFHGILGMKICSNVPGHMTKMASRPIFGKNFQKYLNSSLEQQKLSFLLPSLICFVAIMGKVKVGLNCYLIADILISFYRIVCWVVLYQTYHFYPNLWIWLVAMPTKRLNLRKIFKTKLRCPRYHCPILGSS